MLFYEYLLYSLENFIYSGFILQCLDKVKKLERRVKGQEKKESEYNLPMTWVV